MTNSKTYVIIWWSIVKIIIWKKNHSGRLINDKKNNIFEDLDFRGFNLVKITVLNLQQRKFVANDFINTKKHLIRHLHLNEQGSTQRRNQQKLLFNEITNSTNFDEAPVYGASTFAIVVIKHPFLKSEGVEDFGGKWCKNTFFLEKKTSLITKWSYFKIHVHMYRILNMIQILSLVLETTIIQCKWS